MSIIKKPTQISKELINFTISVNTTSQMESLNFNTSKWENSIDQKKEEQPLKLSINWMIELISNEIVANKNSKAFEILMLQNI